MFNLSESQNEGAVKFVISDGDGRHADNSIPWYRS